MGVRWEDGVTVVRRMGEQGTNTAFAQALAEALVSSGLAGPEPLDYFERQELGKVKIAIGFKPDRYAAASDELI